jgi:hypothetical protein
VPSAPVVPITDPSIVHVDVVFDGRTVSVTPQDVPVGTIEMAFHDARPQPESAVALSVAGQMLLPGGRAVPLWSGPTAVSLIVVGIPDGSIKAVGQVQFVGPEIVPPAEARDVFTIDVAGGAFTLPKRHEFTNGPIVAWARPDDDRWTAVEKGRIEFVVHNPERAQVTIRIEELRDLSRTTNNVSERMKWTLGDRANDRYTLIVKIGDGPDQRLTLWLVPGSTG